MREEEPETHVLGPQCLPRSQRTEPFPVFAEMTPLWALSAHNPVLQHSRLGGEPGWEAMAEGSANRILLVANAAPLSRGVDLSYLAMLDEGIRVVDCRS